MKHRRIFSSLVVIALMIAFTAAAQAQSAGVGGCLKRMLEQRASGASAQPVVETVAVAEPSAARPELQQSGLLDILERQKKAVVGSWQITLGCGCKVLASFAPDGIFLEAGQGDIQPVGSPTPSATAGYGAWAHNGGRQFLATFLIVGYDVPTGEFRGTLKIRIALTLNEAGDQFTGTDKAEIFDPDGHLVDTFTTGTMNGTRIKVEPLN